MGKMRERTHYMKRKKMFIKILLLLAMVFVISGCGEPKSGKSLYKWAKNEYGDCTIVSITETDDKTVVILHDTLQDFDYKVISSMSKIIIDGSNFGSLSDTSDTFKRNLREKVISNVKDELDAICNKEGMRYEYGDSESIISIFAETEKDGREVALKCAEILQKQNINNRLDNLCIDVVGNKYEKSYENENFGSVMLPNISWRTSDDELVEYYTKMARMQTDQNAEFLYSELKVFGDTGADLQRVVKVIGSDYPTERTSPVTFYYFRASDGNKYYLCDFNYYDEDYCNYAWYTNYIR